MSGIRRERIAEAMKEEIAQIMRDEIKDPRIGFASVLRVDVTQDLRVAKVHVSVLGDEESKKNTLKGLQSAAGFMRNEVGRRMNLRFIPELRFVLDTSIEHGVRVASLLNELKGEDKGKGE